MKKNYDTTIYNKQGKPLSNFNRGFPNEEERYVVVELANQINKNLGESLRDNYAMYDYYTKGVFSIEEESKKQAQ